MGEKNKTIFITILLGIILIMAIGYAAFSQTLTINGTAQIDSTWNVYIEDVSVNSEVLDATNKQITVADDKLSATFSADLVSPGSSVTYNVTVKNGGTINAKLDAITFEDSNNDAIIYTYNGIQIGDVINNGLSTTFTVTVTFNSEYTTTPENKTSDLTMYLTYVQA